MDSNEQTSEQFCKKVLRALYAEFLDGRFDSVCREYEGRILNPGCKVVMHLGPFYTKILTIGNSVTVPMSRMETVCARLMVELRAFESMNHGNVSAFAATTRMICDGRKVELLFGMLFEPSKVKTVQKRKRPALKRVFA